MRLAAMIDPPPILFHSYAIDAQSLHPNWIYPPNEIPSMSNEIHLWKLDLSSPNAFELARLNSNLNEAEQARSQRYQLDIHRNRFIARRGLLRIIVARYVNSHPSNLQFTFGEWGKPSINGNAQIQFNTASSDDLAIVAIGTNVLIGTDIEYIDRKVDQLAIAKSLFTPEDAMKVCQSPADIRNEIFTRLWTRYEAVLKTSGRGIAQATGNVTFDNESSRCCIREFIFHEGYFGAVSTYIA